MAVGADHLTLRDLVEHGLPPARIDLGCDVEELVAKVVELEHERIGLPAVRARMVVKIVEQIAGPLDPVAPPDRSGLVDVASIRLVAPRSAGTVGSVAAVARVVSRVRGPLSLVLIDDATGLLLRIRLGAADLIGSGLRRLREPVLFLLPLLFHGASCRWVRLALTRIPVGLPWPLPTGGDYSSVVVTGRGAVW